MIIKHKINGRFNKLIAYIRSFIKVIKKKTSSGNRNRKLLDKENHTSDTETGNDHNSVRTSDI